MFVLFNWSFKCSQVTVSCLHSFIIYLAPGDCSHYPSVSLCLLLVSVCLSLSFYLIISVYASASVNVSVSASVFFAISVCLCSLSACFSQSPFSVCSHLCLYRSIYQYSAWDGCQLVKCFYFKLKRTGFNYRGTQLKLLMASSSDAE